MAQSEGSWIRDVKGGFLVEPLTSWEDFIEFAKDEKKFWPTLIFRGQANSNWTLLSRLDRLENKYPTRPNLCGDIPKEFDCPRVTRETQLKRFRELALDKISKGITKDVLRTIAQHHGLATPLLDFTYSPFVALFFAFEEEKCDCDGVFKKPDKRAVFALTHHLFDASGKPDEKGKIVSELVRPFSASGYGNYRAASQAGVFLKMPDKK